MIHENDPFEEEDPDEKWLKALRAKNCLSFEKAAQAIRERLSCSIGRAEEIVRKAALSREVRGCWWDNYSSEGYDHLELAHVPSILQDPEQYKIFLGQDDLWDWFGRQSLLDSPTQNVDNKKRGRTSPKRDRAKLLLDDVWPDGNIPSQADLPNGSFVRILDKRHRQLCAEGKFHFIEIHDDTFLIAAGRKSAPRNSTEIPPIPLFPLD